MRIWPIDVVMDYCEEKYYNWKNRRDLEKKAYGEAYLAKKIEYLKEKGEIDAKVHVFGKDSINLESPKSYEKSIR
jgi:hypothetical protein